MITLNINIKDTYYAIIFNDFLSTKRVQFEKFPLDCYGCNGENCPLELLEDDEKCEGYGTPLIRLDIKRHSPI